MKYNLKLAKDKWGRTDIDSLAKRKPSGILYFMSMVTRDILEVPAFLTDVSQTFASSWNSEDVFGRMDPIVTFQNTKRSISIAFDLVAGDSHTAIYNNRKADALAMFLYPSYHNPDFDPIGSGDEFNEDFTIDMSDRAFQQAPPLIKMHWNTWVSAFFEGGNTDKGISPSGDQGWATEYEMPSGLLGYIDSLSISPVIENGYYSGGEQDYFKVISISFNFNVIHQDSLGWTPNGNWRGSQSPLGSMDGVGLPGGGIDHVHDIEGLDALYDAAEEEFRENEASAEAAQQAADQEADIIEQERMEEEEEVQRQLLEEAEEENRRAEAEARRAAEEENTPPSV